MSTRRKSLVPSFSRSSISIHAGGSAPVQNKARLQTYSGNLRKTSPRGLALHIWYFSSHRTSPGAQPHNAEPHPTSSRGIHGMTAHDSTHQHAETRHAAVAAMNGTMLKKLAATCGHMLQPRCARSWVHTPRHRKRWAKLIVGMRFHVTGDCFEPAVCLGAINLQTSSNKLGESWGGEENSNLQFPLPPPSTFQPPPSLPCQHLSSFARLAGSTVPPPFTKLFNDGVRYLSWSFTISTSPPPYPPMILYLRGWLDFWIL